jgi:hypothetical protein
MSLLTEVTDVTDVTIPSLRSLKKSSENLCWRSVTFSFTVEDQLTPEDIKELLPIIQEANEQNGKMLVDARSCVEMARFWGTRFNVSSQCSSDDEFENSLEQIKLLDILPLESFLAEDKSINLFVEQFKSEQSANNIFMERFKATLNTYLQQIRCVEKTFIALDEEEKKKAMKKSLKRKAPSAADDDAAASASDVSSGDDSDDEKEDEKKTYRSGFAPIKAIGVQYFPVATSLKRQLYGNFYTLSFGMKSGRGTKDSKGNVKKKTKYLERSFTETYYFGREERAVSWLCRPDLLKLPEERLALARRFVEITGARKYNGLSNAYNKEMGGTSFSGQGHSFIEANSRTYMLTDGYNKSTAKESRYYTSQYLRRDPKKYQFVSVKPGREIRQLGRTSRLFTPEEVNGMIVFFGLEDVFRMTRKDIYPLIFPWKGDWNLKKNCVFVTDFYQKEMKFREQINLFCAKMHQLHVGKKSLDKLAKFRGLYLCDPKRNAILHKIDFLPSQYFRSLTDYDQKIFFLEEERKQEKKDGKRRGRGK